MLCGLADAVDALCAQGVAPRRLLLIGGAAASRPSGPVAAAVFGRRSRCRRRGSTSPTARPGRPRGRCSARDAAAVGPGPTRSPSRPTPGRRSAPPTPGCGPPCTPAADRALVPASQQRRPAGRRGPAAGLTGLGVQGLRLAVRPVPRGPARAPGAAAPARGAGLRRGAPHRRRPWLPPRPLSRASARTCATRFRPRRSPRRSTRCNVSRPGWAPTPGPRPLWRRRSQVSGTVPGCDRAATGCDPA